VRIGVKELHNITLHTGSLVGEVFAGNRVVRGHRHYRQKHPGDCNQTGQSGFHQGLLINLRTLEWNTLFLRAPAFIAGHIEGPALKKPFVKDSEAVDGAGLRTASVTAVRGARGSRR
jgi:hypothetical protein